MAVASKQKPKTAWYGWVGGAALAILVGFILMMRAGDAFARMSYDLPFLFLNHVPNDLVVIYIDRATKINLGEEPDLPLPRRYHARLLEKLKADGVRLVLYDLMFVDRTDDDAELAAAVRKANPVVLVAPPSSSRQENFGAVQITPLAPGLAEAAAGVGLANVDPDPQDNVVRALYAGFDIYPSAGVLAANLLGRSFTNSLDQQRRRLWLNYYGCPLDLRSVNFDHALSPDGLPSGYFSNKIVVVGMRDNPTDQFPCPHRLRGEPPAPGPALQALSALNFLDGDWLTRKSDAWESGVIILWGALMGAGLSRARPWKAALLALLGSAALAAVAVWMQTQPRSWWPWLVPAVAQSGTALLWSVGWQYTIEARRRRQLRRAFGAYLSPYMADQIANSEFDLALGGTEVEATVMFTDLEGFTKMSESLPPAQVSRILTTYFNQTTRAILEQDGTIIKYIGDAVMAVWGAPVGDAKHAERAVLAAWGMSEAGKKEVEGRFLRTRLGVNSGVVLAGNLGSDFRFDYTLIGDTVNFAARLEGLNKYLGTDILISEATRRQLSAKIKVRFLGRFIVVGKKKPVGIYEVLGLAESFPQEPAWLAEFDKALNCFVKHELDEAERLLRQVIELRGGKDGPAEFYLKEIAKAREAVEPDEPWDGTVHFDSK
jgi:adenylate cyclase